MPESSIKWEIRSLFLSSSSSSLIRGTTHPHHWKRGGEEESGFVEVNPDTKLGIPQTKLNILKNQI